MSKVPAWLNNLVGEVAECMEAHNEMGPFGFRYGQDLEMTDVIVYPTPVELIGGENDGIIVLPGFSLDIQELISIFEEIVDVEWCSQNLGLSEGGGNISIEGIYEGHSVWLQIHAEAPADEEPGMKLDVSGTDRK